MRKNRPRSLQGKLRQAKRKPSWQEKEAGSAHKIYRSMEKLWRSKTLAIVKPDAFGRGCGRNCFADSKGRISNRRDQIDAAHEERGRRILRRAPRRGFFGELTDFMSSGKVVVLALEAEGAILKWRDTMGATDPAKAAPGTIRRDLGTSIGNNCTHGSDAPETAAFEVGIFLRRHGTLVVFELKIIIAE